MVLELVELPNGSVICSNMRQDERVFDVYLFISLENFTVSVIFLCVGLAT
jgi:hypothetical protein